MVYDALAYRRFLWHDVPDEVGDVERILTWTGYAVADPDTGVLRPAYVTPDISLPYRPIEVVSMDAEELSGRTDWSALIEVAPARCMLLDLERLMRQLDQSQLAQTILGRQTRYLRSDNANADEVRKLVTGLTADIIPVIETTKALTVDDILPVGDGDTHAESIRAMHDVAMSRFCQALGVHYGDTIKRERLITDEVETAKDAVELIRAREIDERSKLADAMGWTLEVLI